MIYIYIYIYIKPPLPTTTTEKSHNKASGGVMCLVITDTRGLDCTDAR